MNMKSKRVWLPFLAMALLGLTLGAPFDAAVSAQEAAPTVTANEAPPLVMANEPMTAIDATGAPIVEQSTNGLVTLNVEDTLVSQILNAFSRQTGRSIVIGPEITARTTVRLNNVPWNQALESVLRPFGYGYFQDGDTTVVTGVNPVKARVVTLKYLDAADVEPVLALMLSPRGKITRMTSLGQSWGAAASQSQTVAGGEGMGKRSRTQEDPKVTRSKTLIITDTPDILAQIDEFLAKVDVAPAQILIEARFLELNPRVLQDIGFEFGTGGGFRQNSHTYEYGVRQQSGGVAPGNFSAFSTPTLLANAPFNAGIELAFQRLTSVQYDLLFHALQEDASANVLSAPRILTLNNQEAVIIVGTKFPIINSDASSASGGGAATITTSLRGYEDIGIQLNVLPQISDGSMINMIIRPSVRELIGTRSGKTVSGEVTALTEYPVISTREAETQVVMPDRQTVVIGGLLKDRQSKTVVKVPLLGSIPYIGWLFRRETVQNEKVELLIFVTASIVPAEGSELNQAEVGSLANRPSNLVSAPAIISNAADYSLYEYMDSGPPVIRANETLPEEGEAPVPVN